MAIDATLGGSAADSYVTLAAAETYFSARFGSDAWDAASEADQEKALKQAARHVDRFSFLGRRNSPTQARAFPRGYPYNDDPDKLSTALAIPQAIKDAQCEEALAILSSTATGGIAERASLQAQGVRSYSTLGLSETFAPESTRLDEQPLCPQARALLRKWLKQSANWGDPMGGVNVVNASPREV